MAPSCPRGPCLSSHLGNEPVSARVMPCANDTEARSTTLFSWLRFFPSDPAAAPLPSVCRPVQHRVVLSLVAPQGRGLTPFLLGSVQSPCFVPGQQSWWLVAVSKPCLHTWVVRPHRAARLLGLDMRRCGTTTACRALRPDPVLQTSRSCPPKLLPAPKHLLARPLPCSCARLQPAAQPG